MFSGNFVLMVLVIGVLLGLLLKQIIGGIAYGVTILLCGFPTKRAVDGATRCPNCGCEGSYQAFGCVACGHPPRN